jgi:UDP-glucuronate 4-epimerase
VKILITGVAGFIGYHLAKRLINTGNNKIYGIDNLNDYYDVKLKKNRLAQIRELNNFTFWRIDLGDRQALSELFTTHQFDYVINLAAQAGVRYSLENPHAYVDSNLTGFVNLLEGCRQQPIKHLIFASSSSVYGANTKIPFSTEDDVSQPLSLYAATKRANELIAYTYSHLYQIPTTGLRFFTVYGPWGRPDMAYFSFTKKILSGQPIQIFNYGKMQRDFTYVDDIIEGIVCVIENSPSSDHSTPYQLYNLGNHRPVELLYFIELLEKYLGKQAQKEFLPMQLGDVPITYADIDNLTLATGFEPNTPIEVGLEKFVTWYQDYY